MILCKMCCNACKGSQSTNAFIVSCIMLVLWEGFIDGSRARLNILHENKQCHKMALVRQKFANQGHRIRRGNTEEY